MGIATPEGQPVVVDVPSDALAPDAVMQEEVLSSIKAEPGRLVRVVQAGSRAFRACVVGGYNAEGRLEGALQRFIAGDDPRRYPRNRYDR